MRTPRQARTEYAKMHEVLSSAMLKRREQKGKGKVDDRIEKGLKKGKKGTTKK
jgi:hypothetical protein